MTRRTVCNTVGECLVVLVCALSCRNEDPTPPPNATEATSEAAKDLPSYLPIPPNAQGLIVVIGRQSGPRDECVSFVLPEPHPATNFRSWVSERLRDQGWQELGYCLNLPDYECGPGSGWREWGGGKATGIKRSAWWVHEGEGAISIEIDYEAESLREGSGCSVMYRHYYPGERLQKMLDAYAEAHGDVFGAGAMGDATSGPAPR